MSLIKNTLPVADDIKSNHHRPAFKNSLQMLVTSSCTNKKSVVFPINKLEKATIDNVLNTVPLFYNPITKQLILQQDLERDRTTTNQQTANSKKCESDKCTTSRADTANNKVRKLNNLNETFNDQSSQTRNCIRSELNSELNSDCKHEERKFLETQLDDFTTKSINPSQRPVDSKLIDQQQQNIHINHCRVNHKLIDHIVDLNIDKLSLNEPFKLDSIKSQKQPTSPQTTIVTKTNSTVQQTKKDTFRTHRRTPSIHDFHNVIKNNQNHSSKSHSSITDSSAAAAISNLTKTSLASAKSSLCNTINTTAKLNDPMHSTTTTSSKQSQSSAVNKQIVVINESKNELNFYDLDIESETGSVFIKEGLKKYSIDDDTIEPLNLPLPYLEKPKKFSLITSPFQSVLSKLTKSKPNSPINQSSNESSRRNSSTDSSNNTLITSTNGGLLIFENQRPSNLPNKSPDEESNHRELVEQMIRDAKRRELNDAKQIKRNMLKKKKDEERVMSSIKVWQNEIIPNWRQVRETKKVKELWSYGLPSNLRGTIWNLAIGNKLNLSDQSFENYLSKWYDISFDQDKDSKIMEDDRVVNFLSKCSDESVYELIKLDVSRTFPQLKLFQRGAPFHDHLLKLLGSYSISYRPDVGYIQGMSFILGMFLLNMDSKLAFIVFANLLNSSPLLMTFMTVDQRGMQAFYKTFDTYFQINLPQLFDHFKEQKLNTELFMIDWIYTLFTKTVPLDISTRIWDLFFETVKK